MNDFDYENMQKKRLARNAIHRRNGCKSTKCTLPSDYLTAKQRKDLNGMETTYKMNEPVAWNIFKMWPNDIQREYLSGLVERYHVNAARLATMFNIARGTFDPYLKTHHLTDCVPPRGRMQDLEVARWDEFVHMGAKPGDKPTTVTVARNCEEMLVENVGYVTPTEDVTQIEEKLLAGGAEYVVPPSEVKSIMEEAEKVKELPKRVRTGATPTDVELSFALGKDATFEAVTALLEELLGDEPQGMLTVKFQRARKRRSDKKVQGFLSPEGEEAG